LGSTRLPLLGHELNDLPPSRPIILDNITCAYCGGPLDDQTRSKEHVVGRRFVPKGTLNGNWNLILNACNPCNARKADLEDEISAISMQPNVVGEFPSENPALISEAQRKAVGARSRQTGRPVAESSQQSKIELPFFGGKMSVTLSGPPQVASERVGSLAQMHMMAFFYFVTFDAATKTGRFWRGEFVYFPEARREDWGNSTFVTFSKAVAAWEPRFLATGPEEFFKVVLRKHPTADCWSWALEWNQNFRVMGFCGDREAAEEIYSNFPKIDYQHFNSTDGSVWRMRQETPILPDEDELFFWNYGISDSTDGDAKN
jgi:hypothetical protein